MKKLGYFPVRFDDKDILTREFYDDLFCEDYIGNNGVCVLNIKGTPVWMRLVNDLYTLEFNIVTEDTTCFHDMVGELVAMFTYMDSLYTYMMDYNEALKKVWFTIFRETED